MAFFRVLFRSFQRENSEKAVGAMCKHPRLFFLCLSLLLLLPLRSQADVGTAASYNPPYLPTACYGNDTSQFPANNLFAAGGNGIWDNGAACGREYLVRCLSAAQPKACIVDKTIQIRIVDYSGSLASPPSSSGTTMVLSVKAVELIANMSSGATKLNVEFKQV